MAQDCILFKCLKEKQMLQHSWSHHISGELKGQIILRNPPLQQEWKPSIYTSAHTQYLKLPAGSGHLYKLTSLLDTSHSALNLQARSSDDTDPAEAHTGLHAFSNRLLTLALKRGPAMREANGTAVHCGAEEGENRSRWVKTVMLLWIRNSMSWETLMSFSLSHPFNLEPGHHWNFFLSFLLFLPSQKCI